MGLRDQIISDLTAAMKAKDATRTLTLRMLKVALTAFALACRDCNFVLHPGLALEVGYRQEATGRGTTADRGNQAVAHLSKVDGISDSEAQMILIRAFTALLKIAARRLASFDRRSHV